MNADESEVCKYGTPLEPLDEEELPRNKPPTIEEQYALDENGRRRFHGAFTGGFSAGFCNTVGSLEGWTPSTFKSSRKSKAESRFQKPEDFMDSEDREEWGIAPKRLQTTSDYSESANKKKRYIGPIGTIPGDPILHRLMKPPSDNIGVRLLKTMGWREGQGTGPRKKASKSTDDQEDLSVLSGLTFGPNDCENFEYLPKLDSFGMDYSGLNRDIFSKPFSLFEPSTLNIIDKNKKFSIQGQAFGVGTFEDEDDDIYHREDMTQYDFMLENIEKAQPKLKNIKQGSLKLRCIVGFVLSNSHSSKLKTYPLPNVPKNYVPTCGRKTRFGPAINNSQPKIENIPASYLKKGLGRHDLDPDKRRQIIENDITISDKKETNYEEEKKSLLNEANNITKGLGSVTTFRPFAADPEKEKRYNYFTSFNKEDRIEKLRYMQPFGMTEWERDRECREFEQALKLYKPLQGSMSDRFVSGGSSENKINAEPKLQSEEEAAHKKMFGKLTRTVEIWQPVNLLCKRFNVPEPLVGCISLDDANKKTSNYSVFDYTEASVNRKKDYEHNEKSNLEPNIPNKNADTSNENCIKNKGEPYENDKREPPTDIINEVILNKKTIFEKEVEQNLSTNLPENKNLFKLIFAESSDSEDEEHAKNLNKEKIDEMKTFLLSDEPKPKLDCIDESISKTMQEDKIKNTAFGIFANVNLDALKVGPKKACPEVSIKNQKVNLDEKVDDCINSKTAEKKILFQAPSKNKRTDLNTFTTVSSSSLNKITKTKTDNGENELDSKILKYLEEDKIKKKIKKLSSSNKEKKAKKKHKSKEKKKKKDKKSKKSKDKNDKKKS